MFHLPQTSYADYPELPPPNFMAGLEDAARKAYVEGGLEKRFSVLEIDALGPLIQLGGNALASQILGTSLDVYDFLAPAYSLVVDKDPIGTVYADIVDAPYTNLFSRRALMYYAPTAIAAGLKGSSQGRTVEYALVTTASLLAARMVVYMMGQYAVQKASKSTKKRGNVSGGY